MLFTSNVFLFGVHLSLGVSGYLYLMISTYPVVMSICRSRQLWYIYLLMAGAWVACVITASVCLDHEDQLSWLFVFSAWVWTLLFAFECRHYLALHWRRIVTLPGLFVWFALALVYQVLVWAANGMVDGRFPSLAPIWNDACASLTSRITCLDSPGVFCVPSSLITMETWTDMRDGGDAQVDAMRREGTRLGPSVQDLVDGLNGTSGLVFDVGGSRKLNVPWPGCSAETLPYFLDVPWWMWSVLLPSLCHSLAASSCLGPLIP
ncbi:unnamed protein product, partial [Absidia cylindrospora]